MSFPLCIPELGQQLPLMPPGIGAVDVSHSFFLGTTFPASHSWDPGREAQVKWVEVWCLKGECGDDWGVVAT